MEIKKKLTPMPGIERGPRGTSAKFQGKINLT